LLEGSFIWDLESELGSGDDGLSGRPTKGEDYIGKNVYDVFYQVNPRRGDDIPPSLRPIEDILTGKTMEDVHEHCIDSRWYRTRFVPVLGKKDNEGRVNEAFIDGVIGVSMGKLNVPIQPVTFSRRVVPPVLTGPQISRK
jgi:hypothetical protein